MVEESGSESGPASVLMCVKTFSYLMPQTVGQLGKRQKITSGEITSSRVLKTIAVDRTEFVVCL